MKLTQYTDYALRVLMHLAAHPERLCQIGEIAETYQISRNHLMKVVHQLGQAGYIATVRGRSGGIRLGGPPEAISIGEIVRYTEVSLDLADCGACAIAPACGLSGLLDEALGAFFEILDQTTLADIMNGRAREFRALSRTAH